MNILVTALSLYHVPSEKEYVLSIDGRSYQVTGCHTNEPVPKALQLYLQTKQQRLDRIIVLCTPATLTPDSEGISSLDRFRAALGPACARIDHICLEEMSNASAIYGASMTLLSLLEGLEEPELYIDSTGGFRDAMMFFISMLQLLKERGIRVADVLYTVYDRNAKGPYPIISRMDAYCVYDLVSGMEQMRTYGDPRKLKEYFRGRKLPSHATAILDTLQSVYMELQLCRVEQSSKALLRLSELLETYTPGDSTFDTVVALAKEKYGGVRDGFGFADYIKWYFVHGYVPQTLAFFYETLPDLLVENRILYPSDALMVEYADLKDKQVERRTWNYSFINTYFKENHHPAKQQIAQARQELNRLFSEEDPCTPSPTGLKIQKAARAVQLAGMNSNMLKKLPRELEDLLEAVCLEQTPGLTTREEVLRCTDPGKLCKRISHNQKLICRLYNIDSPAAELTPEEHAKLITDAIDGKDICIGTGVSRTELTGLLEKYFYLKAQRNSVLHVGQASASHKTLLKNIQAAIDLLDKVLASVA